MNETYILTLLILLEAYGLIVGILPALVLASLYEFSDEMEADFIQRLKFVRQRLLENKNTLNNLFEESMPFVRQVVEPFAAPVKQFSRTLDAALDLIARIENQHRRLRQSQPGRKAPGQSLLQKARLGTGWGIAWAQSLGLRLRANDLDFLTIQARKDFEGVLAVKDRVANEVRKVMELKDLADQLLSQLKALNLRGGPFEQAALESLSLHQVSSRIPKGFYTGPVRRPVSPGEVDVRLVQSIHNRTNVMRSDYNRLVQQFQRWEAQAADLNQALGSVQQELVRLYTIHHEVAKNLDIRELVDRIFEKSRQARDLAAFASQPDVEAIPQAKQDCLALKRDIQALQRELRQVIGLYENWKSAVTEINQSMNRLKSMFEDQELRQNVYPLKWGATRDGYDQLLAALNEIKDHFYKIRLEQVRQDITALHQLRRPVALLTDQCARRAEKRRLLLGIWAGLESVFSVNLIREWTGIDTEVRRFAAENWEPSLAVDTFRADGIYLINEFRQIIPANRSVQIPEEQLEQLISLSQQASNHLEQFQARAARIRSQLESVWDADRQAGAILSFMLPELDAVLGLFANLQQVEGRLDDLERKIRDEFTQAKAQGTELGEVINRRDSGSVFAKQRAIEAWAQDAINRCQQIIQITEQEAAQQRQAIRERVAELGQIAQLPGETVLQYASQVTSQPDQPYRQQAAINLNDQNMVHLMMEAAGKLIETHLKHRAVMKRIHSELETILRPVRETAQEVEDQLTEISQWYQRAKALDHGNQWPPTFIDIEKINNNLQSLRTRYETVFQGSTRANLKGNYDLLRRDCQRALGLLHRDVSAAEVQAQAIQMASARVQSLLAQKRANINRYLANPDTAPRARQFSARLEAINQGWEALTRGGYRGMLFDDILRHLTQLEVYLGGLP